MRNVVAVMAALAVQGCCGGITAQLRDVRDRVERIDSRTETQLARFESLEKSIDKVRDSTIVIEKHWERTKVESIDVMNVVRTLVDPIVLAWKTAIDGVTTEQRRVSDRFAALDGRVAAIEATTAAINTSITALDRRLRASDGRCTECCWGPAPVPSTSNTHVTVRISQRLGLSFEDYLTVENREDAARLQVLEARILEIYGTLEALEAQRAAAPGRCDQQTTSKTVDTKLEALLAWLGDVKRVVPGTKGTADPIDVHKLISAGEDVLKTARVHAANPWLAALLDAIPGQWLCKDDNTRSSGWNVLAAGLTAIWTWFVGLGQYLRRLVDLLRRRNGSSAEDFVVLQNGRVWWAFWIVIGGFTLWLILSTCFGSGTCIIPGIIVALLVVDGVLLLVRPARRGRRLLKLEERLEQLATRLHKAAGVLGSSTFSSGSAAGAWSRPVLQSVAAAIDDLMEERARLTAWVHGRGGRALRAWFPIQPAAEAIITIRLAQAERRLANLKEHPIGDVASS